MTSPRPDRERATAIFIRNGLVLTALDEDVDFCYLPGGRNEDTELPKEVMPDGEPTPSHEIGDVVWWDQSQDFIVHKDTKNVLSKYRDSILLS